MKKRKVATTKVNQDSSYVPPAIVCDTCGSQRLRRDTDGVHCRECGAVVNGAEIVKPATTKKVGQARLFE
jgi:ribosomal protein L37AE/L43A